MGAGAASMDPSFVDALPCACHNATAGSCFACRRTAAKPLFALATRESLNDLIAPPSASGGAGGRAATTVVTFAPFAVEEALRRVAHCPTCRNALLAKWRVVATGEGLELADDVRVEPHEGTLRLTVDGTEGAVARLYGLLSQPLPAPPAPAVVDLTVRLDEAALRRDVEGVTRFLTVQLPQALQAAALPLRYLHVGIMLTIDGFRFGKLPAAATRVQAYEHMLTRGAAFTLLADQAVAAGSRLAEHLDQLQEVALPLTAHLQRTALAAAISKPLQHPSMATAEPARVVDMVQRVVMAAWKAQPLGAGDEAELMKQLLLATNTAAQFTHQLMDSAVAAASDALEQAVKAAILRRRAATVADVVRASPAAHALRATGISWLPLSEQLVAHEDMPCFAGDISSASTASELKVLTKTLAAVVHTATASSDVILLVSQRPAIADSPAVFAERAALAPAAAHMHLDPEGAVKVARAVVGSRLRAPGASAATADAAAGDAAAGGAAGDAAADEAAGAAADAGAGASAGQGMTLEGADVAAAMGKAGLREWHQLAKFLDPGDEARAAAGAGEGKVHASTIHAAATAAAVACAASAEHLATAYATMVARRSAAVEVDDRVARFVLQASEAPCGAAWEHVQHRLHDCMLLLLPGLLDPADASSLFARLAATLHNYAAWLNTWRLRLTAAACGTVRLRGLEAPIKGDAPEAIAAAEAAKGGDAPKATKAGKAAKNGDAADAAKTSAAADSSDAADRDTTISAPAVSFPHKVVDVFSPWATTLHPLSQDRLGDMTATLLRSDEYWLDDKRAWAAVTDPASVAWLPCTEAEGLATALLVRSHLADAIASLRRSFPHLAALPGCEIAAYGDEEGLAAAASSDDAIRTWLPACKKLQELRLLQRCAANMADLGLGLKDGQAVHATPAEATRAHDLGREGLALLEAARKAAVEAQMRRWDAEHSGATADARARHATTERKRIEGRDLLLRRPVPAGHHQHHPATVADGATEPLLLLEVDPLVQQMCMASVLAHCRAAAVHLRAAHLELLAAHTHLAEHAARATAIAGVACSPVDGAPAAHRLRRAVLEAVAADLQERERDRVHALREVLAMAGDGKPAKPDKAGKGDKDKAGKAAEQARWEKQQRERAAAAARDEAEAKARADAAAAAAKAEEERLKREEAEAIAARKARDAERAADDAAAAARAASARSAAAGLKAAAAPPAGAGGAKATAPPPLVPSPAKPIAGKGGAAGTTADPAAAAAPARPPYAPSASQGPPPDTAAAKDAGGDGDGDSWLPATGRGSHRRLAEWARAPAGLRRPCRPGRRPPSPSPSPLPPT
jgi:trimeric autotransporter adhesin